LTFSPHNYGDTNTEIFDLKTFPSPATLVAGTIYYLVFSGSSDVAWTSVNQVYDYAPYCIPRQPRWLDAEFGALVTNNNVWEGLDPGLTPVCDLVYANGTIDGNSYFEAMVASDNYATITGTTKMAREWFVVSGGNKVVKSIAARVRRTSGTSPLILTIESLTSAGVHVADIESVSIPAVNIPISTPDYDGGPGGVWVKAPLTTSRTLTNGVDYAMRISCAADTVYTTYPVRTGVASAFGPGKGYTSWAFKDGNGQKTINGTTWTDMYPYDLENLMFYFELV
jgi:hypothetical protein